MNVFKAYARQCDENDLEVLAAKIKLRSAVRIGELVRELAGGREEQGIASASRGGILTENNYLDPKRHTADLDQHAYENGSPTHRLADAGLSRSKVKL